MRSRPTFKIHAAQNRRSAPSAAACREAKILAEKRQDMILETISHPARMSAWIQFKAVRDSILIESIVELGGIGSQTILVTYVNRDRAILAKIPDVLIHEC
jgi:hypothetical protein